MKANKSADRKTGTGTLADHIVKSRIQPIQKEHIGFTTKPRHKRKTTIDISRKGSVVREKCGQLAEIALNLFPDRRISNEDLGDLIKRYVGGDRETVRAYLGYRGRLTRNKRTGEGYVIGNSRKGYLEIFGFMHPVSNGDWVIHVQMKLPNADSEFHTNEGSGVLESKEKISLSERGRDDTFTEVLRGGGSVVSENENNNNNTTARERNFAPKIFQRLEKPELNSEELAILTAKPVDSEPDLARLKCPKIQWRPDHG